MNNAELELEAVRLFKIPDYTYKAVITVEYGKPPWVQLTRHLFDTGGDPVQVYEVNESYEILGGEAHYFDPTTGIGYGPR